MRGKLILEITLGNDAMHTGEDLAGAVLNVARRLSEEGLPVTRRSIKDGNGNTVGHYRIGVNKRRLT